MKKKKKTSEDEFLLKIPNFENSTGKGSNRRNCPRKKKSKKALKTSASNRPHDNGEGSFENMIITCNSSVESLDEITLGEEFDLIKEASKLDDIHVDLSDRFEESSRNTPRRTANASDGLSSTPVRVSSRHTSSSNSASKLQTDVNTGKYFIWKKGPNNRYIKVPINGLNETNDGSVQEGSTASTLSYSNISEGIDLDRLEEKLVDEALNRSVAESLTEDELVELALSRSLQDLSTSGSNLTSDKTDTRMDFVWRKRPNNAYFKCPATSLGQVNEGDEYGDN